MNYWITLQKRFSIDFHLKIESVAQLIWKQNHALLRMCRSPLRAHYICFELLFECIKAG